jgi:Uma2 family endonuclease
MTILTATRPLPKTKTESIVDVPIWRISVAQYHQMIKAGILTDGDPVELLEGLLVEKMSKKPAHRAATLLFRRTLERMIERVVDGEWYIDSQEPITTSDSEPEPDITVIRGDTLDYLDRHPGPEDTALVVEVADATLRRDRGIKKRLYARAGVPVYWVVNVNKLEIEVYSQPDQQAAKPDYQQHRIYHTTELIPVILDGIEIGRIPVNDVLPPQLVSQSKG